MNAEDLIKFGRCYMAAHYRLNGLTYKEVGEMIGRVDDNQKPVTPSRARQLVEKGNRLIIRHADRLFRNND